jgi:hypothetical protein
MKPVIAFLLLGALAVPVSAEPNIDEVVLPAKTEIFIELLRGLNSKTAREGDKFSATVQVPVTLDDQIVIPAGSYVIGHVVYRRGAGYIRGRAELQLAFDTIILARGVTRNMQAVAGRPKERSPTPPMRRGD